MRSTTFQEDVTAAEAEAVKWGMEMAKETRLMDVIVETDCMEVVNLANNETNNRKEIMWTISEIQECKAGFQLKELGKARNLSCGWKPPKLMY